MSRLDKREWFLQYPHRESPMHVAIMVQDSGPCVWRAFSIIWTSPEPINNDSIRERYGSARPERTVLRNLAAWIVMLDDMGERPPEKMDWDLLDKISRMKFLA
jgi:hypothetical protein